MERKYIDLTQLLNENPGAKKFFNTLPDYVQSSIADRGDNIHTDRDLRSYAENLLRGDG